MDYIPYNSYDVYPELKITHIDYQKQTHSWFYYDEETYWQAQVNIEPSETRDQFQYDVLFDHEVNHHVYFTKISDKQRKQWETIYSYMWQDDFVRDYAKQNANEAFADTLSHYENWLEIPDTKIWTLTALYSHVMLKKHKSDDKDTMKVLESRRKELTSRIKKHFK